jgi:hypothetical protein
MFFLRRSSGFLCLAETKHRNLLCKILTLSFYKNSMHQIYFPAHITVLITCNSLLTLDSRYLYIFLLIPISASVTVWLIFFIWCYSPLWALASLITAFQLSLSCAVFHQAVTSKILRSYNTSSSHLNFGVPFFLLPSGWEKVNFSQNELSSLLLICPNHFNLFILIDWNIFGSLNNLYNSSSYFILSTPFT